MMNISTVTGILLIYLTFILLGNVLGFKGQNHWTKNDWSLFEWRN